MLHGWMVPLMVESSSSWSMIAATMESSPCLPTAAVLHACRNLCPCRQHLLAATATGLATTRLCPRVTLHFADHYCRRPPAHDDEASCGRQLQVPPRVAMRQCGVGEGGGKGERIANEAAASVAAEMLKERQSKRVRERRVGRWESG
ncbi:hypothetical protein SEVIR_1G143850v4 [Setaria viridis]